MTAGTEDPFSAVAATNALAAAGCVPILQPLVSPTPAHQLRQLAPEPLPVRGNVATANGEHVTAELRQVLANDNWWSPCCRCSWRTPDSLPSGRDQARDHHLKFYDERDNLLPSGLMRQPCMFQRVRRGSGWRAELRQRADPATTATRGEPESSGGGGDGPCFSGVGGGRGPRCVDQAAVARPSADRAARITLVCPFMPSAAIVASRAEMEGFFAGLRAVSFSHRGPDPIAAGACYGEASQAPRVGGMSLRPAWSRTTPRTWCTAIAPMAKRLAQPTM